MEKKILDKIDIMQGDITSVKVDAIVNAANKFLKVGGGVDGAIHRAAGRDLAKECKTIGGCPTGEARITKGFSLPAKYVIHAVGPIYNEAVDKSGLLASCYQDSLYLAVQHNASSIAFPAISCGVYGYPIEAACKIAVDTTCEFLKNNPAIKKVIFVLFSQEDYQVYKDYIGSLK